MDIQQRQHNPGFYFSINTGSQKTETEHKQTDSLRVPEQIPAQPPNINIPPLDYSNIHPESKNETSLKLDKSGTENDQAEDENNETKPEDDNDQKPENIEAPEEKDDDIRKRDHDLALWFAIFLGILGIHRLYLGYYWTGIAQLILGIFAIAVMFYMVLLGYLGYELFTSGDPVGELVGFLIIILFVASVVIALLVLPPIIAWWIRDYRRIRDKEMKPNNGQYE